MKFVTISTGLPFGNGQVEILNYTVISLISKTSKDEPNKWFKYISKV